MSPKYYLWIIVGFLIWVYNSLQYGEGFIHYSFTYPDRIIGAFFFPALISNIYWWLEERRAKKNEDDEEVKG